VVEFTASIINDVLLVAGGRTHETIARMSAIA